jgi:hypothetical protein
LGFKLAQSAVFVAGLSAEEILEEMSDLERDDLKAALA